MTLAVEVSVGGAQTAFFSVKKKPFFPMGEECFGFFENVPVTLGAWKYSHGLSVEYVSR